MKHESRLKEDLKSPWLLGILGTIFLAVSVNGVMIYLSYKNPHSLVAKDYYQKGKAYFHDKANHQNVAKKLGLILNLVIPDTITSQTPAVIGLAVTDAGKNPYKGQQGTLYAYRPDDMNHDFKITMKENPEGGYSAEAVFPLPGNWDLIGQLEVNGEKVDVARRIFVRK